MNRLFKKYHFEIVLTLILIVIGQLIFLLMSERFTQPSYEGRIFAVNGVRQQEHDDLHSLHNAAHFFNETIIGWARFPSFTPEVRLYADLPEDAGVGGSMQERQNVIFNVNSVQPLTQEQLEKTAEFIQDKLAQYNAVNDTQFSLSNLDYELATVQKSYRFGAAAALLVALVLGVGIGFIRRELIL